VTGVQTCALPIFTGTSQRTIGQQRGGGLPVALNETGIQTSSPGGEYYGWEVSATPAGGVLGRWATQSYQARWYLAMLKLVACDANVRGVNIFHLLDEADLEGWQSGLYFADGTPKRSAATVRSWIESTGATCRGRTTPWEPGDTGIPSTIALSKLKLPTATPRARVPTAVPSPQPVVNPDPITVAPSAAPPPESAPVPADDVPPAADDVAPPTDDPPPPADDTPPPDTPPPSG